MFNQQLIYSFGQIQTSQTGGQPYSDTSPYNVSFISLHKFVLKTIFDICPFHGMWGSRMTIEMSKPRKTFLSAGYGQTDLGITWVVFLVALFIWILLIKFTHASFLPKFICHLLFYVSPYSSFSVTMELFS